MIQVDDDCLPEDLLANVRAVVMGLGFRYGWKSNADDPESFGHWNVQILNADRHNTEDVTNALRILPAPFIWISALWNWLQVEKFGRVGGQRAALLRCYANQHTYGTEGAPHTDSTREGEFTTLLYCNPTWDRRWAGATEIWDAQGEEIERAVMPRPGRLLTFPGTRWHRASSVARACPVARTTLMFKVRA